MRSFTIYLSEDASRSRKRALAALLLALLAIGALARPPQTETVTIEVPKTVVERVYVDRPTYTDRVQYIERKQPPPPILTSKTFAQFIPPETVDPQTRHLCVSPRWVNLTDSGYEAVTVSNPSAGEIAITGIRAVSDRAKSGFVINAADCRDRILRQGERCTIEVAVGTQIGETMQLLIANDASDPPEIMTVIASER